MYQLLIVDDETSVVDSLALTVPWDEYGIDEVHRAYSAQEALHIATKHMIDIMIVDVQMPEMNGLELIERIRSFSRKIHCIILSGHDEFEYAKKAMSFQVLDYLLKPVDMTELVDTVKKTIHQIEKEWEEISSFQRIQQTLQANLPLIRSQLLNDLLRDKNIHPDFLEERLSMVEVPFRFSDSCVMMVIRMEEDFSGYDLKSLSLLEFAVTNIAAEVFRDLFDLWYCVTEQGYLVFLIKSQQEDVLKLADSYAVKLQNHVQKFLQGSLSICLSQIERFPEGISDRYHASINAINQNVGDNKSYFLTIDQQHVAPQGSILKKLNAPPTFPSLLESGSWDEALAKLDEFFFHDDQAAELTQGHLYTVLLFLSSSIALYIATNEVNMSKQINDEFELLLFKKGHLSKQRVYDWAANAISKLKSITSSRIVDSQQMIAMKVRSYIQDNLAVDTSLQTIANHIGMHPVYLSKIYKSVMNETIGDYIFRIRMERAVHLLRNTDMKISEIIGELGFWSSPHFIKIFKEHFGMTPQEYRNS